MKSHLKWKKKRYLEAGNFRGVHQRFNSSQGMGELSSHLSA